MALGLRGCLISGAGQLERRDSCGEPGVFDSCCAPTRQRRRLVLELRRTVDGDQIPSRAARRVIGGGLTNMIQRKQGSLKEAICTGRRANQQRISSREVEHQQRDDPKEN